MLALIVYCYIYLIFEEFHCLEQLFDGGHPHLLFSLSHLIKLLISDGLYHISILTELGQILKRKILEELCVLLVQRTN